MNRKLTNAHGPLLALVAVLALASAAACARRDVPLTGDAGTTAAEVPARSRTTDDIPLPEPPRAPHETPAPAPAAVSTDAATIGATTTEQGIVEPPLAAWAPESGRLTIVQASDLARNLGIADASISEPVAPSPAAPPPAAPPPPPSP